MLALHHEPRATAAPETGRTKWLAVLESELKRRIGWVDEAVSPFARKRTPRPANTSTKLHRAA